MEKWSDSLTEDQIKVMEILGGLIASIISLFEFMTKDI